MNSDRDVEDLLDEIRRRVTRLERDAARLRSVRGVRELLEQTFEAGVASGRAQQLAFESQRASQVLDAATAGMADNPPNGIDANDANVKYWRDGRQQLWHLVEQTHQHQLAEQMAEQERASKRRAWIEQRCGELLAPEPPLRVRVGRWLIDGSDWIAGMGKLRQAVRP